MKKNLGLPDSYLRIGVALALTLLVLDNHLSGIWAALAIIVALVFGVTAYLRFCPIYAFFGINKNMEQDQPNR